MALKDLFKRKDPIAINEDNNEPEIVSRKEFEAGMTAISEQVSVLSGAIETLESTYTQRINGLEAMTSTTTI